MIESALDKAIALRKNQELIRRNAPLLEVVERARQEQEQKRAELLARGRTSTGKIRRVARKELSVVQKRKAYKALVWRLTDGQNLSGLKDIEKRAWRKYDLDHIISIYDGFRLGLTPETIASIDNLRIIPHKENSIKSSASHYNAHPLGGLMPKR